MATRGLREKEKKLNDLHQMILTNMLNEPENKFCAECGVKGPRWASWNLGVFMCIRCSGIHRNLGVHISKVRSVNLDTWRPEWIESMQALGNHKAAQIWEYHLPRDFKRPADNDQEMEAFIRAKYERSRFKRRPEDPALESDVRPAGVASAPAAVAAPVTAAADARKDKKASSSSAHGGPASASAAHHPNASGAHAFAHNGPHSAHHHQHGHGHHAPAQVHPQVHIRSVLPPGGGAAAAPGPVIPPATAAAPVAAAPVQVAAPAPAPTKAQTIQDDLFSLLGPAPAAAPASNGAPSNSSSDFFTQSSQSLQESKHAAKMNDIMSLFNSAPSQPAGGFNNNINNNMGGSTSTAASNANMNALNSVFGAPAAAIPPQQYQQQQQPFQQQQMGGFPPGFGMPPPQQQHQQQQQQPFGMQGFPGYGQPAQPQQHYQQQPQQSQPFGASPFGANPFGAAPAPAPAAGYNPFAMQPTPAAYARPPTQGSGITLDTSLWQ
eukprot:m.104728 g.104728  ORF g.104728 m.104728 type:complete len:493 (-) comp15768_c1_seq1:969-2447(-)